MVTFFCATQFTLYSQELQLHYDFRHSVDPKLNSKNFPLINFKYFKELDTLGTGSFLLEAQSFLNGEDKNIGQTFFQISQSIKFWKPKVYLSLNYSGGLGVAPPFYGYYISNAYGVGISYPLAYTKIWFNFNLMSRYSNKKMNPQFNFYVGGGFFNYRLMYSSSIVSWTTDKNDGLPANAHKKGKKIAFFGDPQIWYGIGKGFSVGSRVSLYYQVLSDEDRLMAYPTLGIKKGF